MVDPENPFSYSEDEIDANNVDADVGLLSDDEVGLGLVSDGDDGNASDANNAAVEVENNDITNDDNSPEGNEPRPTPVEPKQKKVVKNPQPKIDLKRLKGPRGLTALDDTFKDFRFKGSGHEKGDLNALLLHYEHWAHRLFPRYTFDDCLEQLEIVGHKKEVQTLIKKVRLGMHTADDHVELFDDDDDGDDNKQPVVIDDPDDPPVDVFDTLINELDIPTRIDHAPQVSSPPELTAEQLERMEQNRLRAQEKRLARLRALQEQNEINATC